MVTWMIDRFGSDNQRQLADLNTEVKADQQFSQPLRGQLQFQQVGGKAKTVNQTEH